MNELLDKMTADKRLKVVVFDSAEGTGARGTKMLELGIGRKNDFEMRLGHHLGRLAETADLAEPPP